METPSRQSIQRLPSSVAGQRARLVRDEPRPRQLGVDLRVRLTRVGRLAFDARAVACRQRRDGVDDAATDPTAARPDCDDDRRAVAGADEDVLGAAGAVEVVPRLEPQLLLLDDEQALTLD